MANIQLKREDLIFIRGREYRYWDKASSNHGTHYVYIDVPVDKLSSAELQEYRRMKYFYTTAMNHPYYEVPEYELIPKTNRQAAGLLSQEG